MKKDSITKNIDGEIYYRCNKCKQFKSKECFNKDLSNFHNNRNGLCRECKDCQKERYISERKKLEDDSFALNYKLYQLFKGSQRRSKLKNMYSDITHDYLKFLWEKQKGKCAITGIPMTYKFYNGRTNTNVSIDRIDSSKGYTKDNIHLVCMVVNQMKNDLSIDELLSLCELIINNNKKQEN